jgi:hypothetical protein
MSLIPRINDELDKLRHPFRFHSAENQCSLACGVVYGQLIVSGALFFETFRQRLLRFVLKLPKRICQSRSISIPACVIRRRCMPMQKAVPLQQRTVATSISFRQ